MDRLKLRHLGDVRGSPGSGLSPGLTFHAKFWVEMGLVVMSLELG